MKSARVEAKPDVITRRDVEVGVDSSSDGIAANHSKEVLIGSEDLDHLDLQVKHLESLHRPLREGFGSDSEDGLFDPDGPRQLDFEP